MSRVTGNTAQIGGEDGHQFEVPDSRSNGGVASLGKPEFRPLLEAGFHRMDVQALRRLCVDRFPDSITRRQLMRNLEDVISLVNKSGIRGEIWIDGSFTTEKLNPDDVDLLLAVDAKDFSAMTPPQRQFFNWFCRVSLFLQYRCDNYGLIVNHSEAQDEWLYAYWLRQFGFSRRDEMKGLAVVPVPFLVTP